MSRGRRAAFIAAGVGAALVVIGGVAFAAPGPSDCHDEECWVPQLGAGSALFAIGGVAALSGLIAVAALKD